MVDYSKWRDIEISDDEDETHPNVDTPSLFRWRHQARIERMAEFEREKEALKLRKQSNQAKILDVQQKLKNKEGDEIKLQNQLDELKKESKSLAAEEDELLKKEKNLPWNVDTISKPGFAKTVLNKDLRKDETTLTDEEREEVLRVFIKDNEKLCKEYGMLHKFEDSKRFLQKHPQLVCENTTNYLVLWSVNLEMDEKHDLMAHVAHQCICMQYILELSKSLDVDPRSCVASFFNKIQNCAADYRKEFEDEIEGFKERIRNRAAERLKTAIAEVEEEERLERLERLGPGGLDPVEVFDSLPPELQECFEKRDIELLKIAVTKLPVEEAKYHMRRCVDSGLWVPNSTEDEMQMTGNTKVKPQATSMVNGEW